MKKVEIILDTPAGSLHYQKIGTGSKALLAFHGFGQSGNVFHALAESLGSDWCLYAFDIFYHGFSSRSSSEPLTIPKWNRAFEQFCLQEKLEAFEVLGFSLGGKFALASMMARPRYCRAIHLLAPDGIAGNFWYNLATYPIVFRKAFERLLDNPDQLLVWLNRLERIGLIDSALSKFVAANLMNDDLRHKIQLTWTMFKPLKFPTKTLADTINKFEIRPYFYFGKYDQLLKADDCSFFLQKLDYYQCHVLDANHQNLIRKSISFFQK